MTIVVKYNEQYNNSQWYILYGTVMIWQPTSSCEKIFLICRKHPYGTLVDYRLAQIWLQELTSAMSKSSAHDLPLNNGCGALSKYLLNGKCSVRAASPSG